MSISRLDIALEVQERVGSHSTCAEIETCLYEALAGSSFYGEAREAVIDVLALLLRLKQTAADKGTKRDRGIRVLDLLNLTNAKFDLKKHRDSLVYVVYLNETETKQRAAAAVRDELSHLMGTHPSEVSKILKECRDDDVRSSNQSLPSTMSKDLKQVISELSEKIGNRSGD